MICLNCGAPIDISTTSAWCQHCMTVDQAIGVLPRVQLPEKPYFVPWVYQFDGVDVKNVN